MSRIVFLDDNGNEIGWKGFAAFEVKEHRNEAGTELGIYLSPSQAEALAERMVEAVYKLKIEKLEK